MVEKTPIEKFEEYKKQFKKKYWALSIVIFILLGIFFIYWNNFTGSSKVLEETNPFTEALGITRISITLNNNPIIDKNRNFIPIVIENTGDRKIEKLELYYELGGYKLRRATDFGFNKLDVGEKQEFKIQIVDETMNLSCSEIVEFTMDLYFDEKGNCYFEPKNYAINVCMYHSISILAYSNEKLIQNHTEWYPYFQGPLLINTSLTRPQSCREITDEDIKEGLKHSSIGVAFLDISTYCKKGNDPRWCLNLRS